VTDRRLVEKLLVPGLFGGQAQRGLMVPEFQDPPSLAHTIPGSERGSSSAANLMKSAPATLDELPRTCSQ
jgi:hypothetical protein